MCKVSFTNEVMAKDYINGLMRSGMTCVKNISEITKHSFCVVENDVCFMLRK